MNYKLLREFTTDISVNIGDKGFNIIRENNDKIIKYLQPNKWYSINDDDKKELKKLIYHTIVLYEKTILPSFSSLRLMKKLN